MKYVFKLRVKQTNIDSRPSLSLCFSLISAEMGKQQLHIALIPVVAQGHTIPVIDMARLFTSRGVKTTIIATPSFADPIQKARDSGHDIGLIITPFPPKSSSLPANVVSLDQIMTNPDLIARFFRALQLLQDPVDAILHEIRPDCLISDMFLPWTTHSAAKLGIPRLLFCGTNCFSRCASTLLYRLKPYAHVSSDDDSFLVPDLPHQLMFVKTQVPKYVLLEEMGGGQNEFTKLRKQIEEAEAISCGEIFNSFHEIEPDYVEPYRNIIGIKEWHIGPLSSCKINQDQRKDINDDQRQHYFSWLDSKKPNSVVYVCFGSMVNFTPAQLHEIAVGLEASGQDFIWVVRRGKGREKDDEDWLPEEFEERVVVKRRGVMIREWAPQVMILDHAAIGAFVTHCGWNSTLEGICAGVPMVTWPVFAEQFYNEKLVTEVLGTGVSVGNKKWEMGASEGVGREAVAEAVERVMVGAGAAEMKRRAEYYKEMAKRAVEEGGSSYNALNELIHDLSNYSNSNSNSN